MTNPRRGRPPAQLPDGWITLAAAALELDCSLSTVYKLRHLGGGAEMNGVWALPVARLDDIRAGMRAPNGPGRSAKDGRTAIMVRVPIALADAWQTIAGPDVPLATWLRGLAERELAGG